ncbi:hypothetical protein BH24ACT19_BH24ACT19_03490 [soil metagenome]
MVGGAVLALEDKDIRIRAPGAGLAFFDGEGGEGVHRGIGDGVRKLYLRAPLFLCDLTAHVAPVALAKNLT